MARLKFPNEEPPGGWVYLEPRSRLTIKGENLAQLVQKVIQHREHRGFQPTDPATVRVEIERQICTKLGDALCRREGEGDDWQPINGLPAIRLSTILSLSRAGLDWIAAGRPMVEMAEVGRRREICLACPLNEPLHGCMCAPFYRLISRTIPADRRFDDLHVCRACGCSVTTMVNLPMDVLDESHAGREIAFPVTCWQHPAAK